MAALARALDERLVPDRVEEPFGLGHVRVVAAQALGALEREAAVRGGHRLRARVVAARAQHRHRLLEQTDLARRVPLVAGQALAVAHRLVELRARLRHRAEQVVVAGQAEAAHRTGEQARVARAVRIVAGAAVAGRHRGVDRARAGDLLAHVVALGAELAGLALEQAGPARRVRHVAGGAVALLERRMELRAHVEQLLLHRRVALGAQVAAPGAHELRVLAAVRRVARGARAFGPRRVHDRQPQLLALRVVTLDAQRRPPARRQRGSFAAVRRVAGGAVALGRRRVLHRLAADRLRGRVALDAQRRAGCGEQGGVGTRVRAVARAALSRRGRRVRRRARELAGDLGVTLEAQRLLRRDELARDVRGVRRVAVGAGAVREGGVDDLLPGVLGLRVVTLQAEVVAAHGERGRLPGGDHLVAARAIGDRLVRGLAQQARVGAAVWRVAGGARAACDREAGVLRCRRRTALAMAGGAELGDRLREQPRLAARVRVVAGQAVLPHRRMGVGRFEALRLVAGEAGGAARRLEQAGQLRRVRDVARRALALGDRRVHVRLLVVLPGRLVARVAELRLLLLERERADDAVALVARLAVRVGAERLVHDRLRALALDLAVALDAGLAGEPGLALPAQLAAGRGLASAAQSLLGEQRGRAAREQEQGERREEPASAAPDRLGARARERDVAVGASRLRLRPALTSRECSHRLPALSGRPEESHSAPTPSAT